MRMTSGVLILTATLTTGIAAAQIDRARLRKAVQFPGMSVKIGFGLTEASLLSRAEKRDVRAEIARVEKAIKGDAGDAERTYRLGRLYRQAIEERGGEGARERGSEGATGQWDDGTTARALHAASGTQRERGIVRSNAPVRELNGPEATDWIRAMEASAKSVELYRRQVQAHPDDRRLLMAFGNALTVDSKYAEAERVLRKVVEAAPREWRAWVALGEALHGRASEVRAGEFAPPSAPDLATFLQQVQQFRPKPPSPDQMAQAEALAREAERAFGEAVKVAPREWQAWTALGGFLDERSREVLLDAMIAERLGDTIDAPSRLLGEGGRCFDQAVAVAPKEAQVYSARVRHRVAVGVWQTVVRSLRGEPVDENAIALSTLLAPECLADLRRALRGSAAQPRALATVLFLEVLTAAGRNYFEQKPGSENLPSTLPEAARRSARKEMGQLGKLAKSKDPRTAADATTYLGLLQLMALEDPAAAEASFRRAVALDPARDQAWDLLCGLLRNDHQRHAEEIALGRERLKHGDSVRARMTLAGIYAHVGRYPEAEEQIQAALKLEPGGFAANVGLAALLMLRDDSPAVLSRVKELLANAARALGPVPKPEDWSGYAVNRSIYLALSDDVAAARRQLTELLAKNPQEMAATEALAALGQ